MTLKTDKSQESYELEFCVAQLRHAYQQLIAVNDNMGRNQLLSFANGLIAPVIRRLEKRVLSDARAERQG